MIYHYYSSKKDVYLAVIDMWENQTQELLAPAADEKSSAKAIKELFKNYLSIFIIFAFDKIKF